MQFQVNTDNQIIGSQRKNEWIESVLEDSLGRFNDWITRVEVHLTDESSSSKSVGDDKRCVIEARPSGRQPVSVSNTAPTDEQAVKGASSKMVHQLDSIAGKMRDAGRRRPTSDDQISDADAEAEAENYDE